MERVTIRRFDIGEGIRSVDVEGHGYKWLFYWLLGDEHSRAYITDGLEYVMLPDPEEWRETYRHAIVMTGVPATSVDLTCERLKQRMRRQNLWKPLA
jgi:hypothetical protein